MLHTWPARRPLAASRATAYAALIPAFTDEAPEKWNAKRDFIITLSDWDNSLSQSFIEHAQADILEANGGEPPKVLDPFGGGGALPLEALRLGCETYSMDLNPVAVLIQKCTLEYPQRFKHRLQEDVNKWGDWVFNEVKKELDTFYPVEADGSFPTGYIWARTIPCPYCNVDIPLMRTYWLVNKPKTKAKTKVALCPKEENGRIEFKIVGDGYDDPMPNRFDPKKGNVKQAVAECLACKGTVPAKKTQQLFQDEKAGARIIAVVMHTSEGGKYYRIATVDDEDVFALAKKALLDKQQQLKMEWGMDPVPDEPLPPKNSHRAVGSQLPLYNFKKWGDIFNDRQNLALVTFIEKIRLVYREIKEAEKAEKAEKEYAKAVVSYLALMLTRHACYNATLCWWDAEGQRPCNIYGRQTLAMVYDYPEQNPCGILTGNWLSQVKNTTQVVLRLSSTLFQRGASVCESSATKLPHPDDFFDAVFTDPPYYDNVPYSYLSDFYYVWLKRAVGDVYPELFVTELTTKTNEIVAYSNVPAEFRDGKDYFEKLLKKSFQEIYRVLKPNKGIAIIVYAHTSTEGWETLINSLMDSGLVVTSAWTLHTEQTSRLTAKDAATLTSSIYIVVRKMAREETGYYDTVKTEMNAHLKKKLTPLWEEGMAGADFGIAAIGAALVIFGKYEEVRHAESMECVSATDFLNDVRQLTCEYAIQQILHNGFADEISPLTRFYILWRRDHATKRISFDEALRLAQFCGVDIDQALGNKKGFIVKEKKFIYVRGPQDRETEMLQGAREMIDVLHYVLLLWTKGQIEEMHHVIASSEYAESDVFERVAQTIYMALQEGDERQLLGGFLGGNGWKKAQEGVKELQMSLFNLE